VSVSKGMEWGKEKNRKGYIVMWRKKIVWVSERLGDLVRRKICVCKERKRSDVDLALGFT
jgi:hypothetical protein